MKSFLLVVFMTIGITVSGFSGFAYADEGEVNITYRPIIDEMRAGEVASVMVTVKNNTTQDIKEVYIRLKCNGIFGVSKVYILPKQGEVTMPLILNISKDARGVHKACLEVGCSGKRLAAEPIEFAVGG